MPAIPVIAIFDIGKTNKKLFCFDDDYHIVFERSARFTDTRDEDGDPCEDVESLRAFVSASLKEVFENSAFSVKALNFSTYGASFVHLNADGKPVTPLYNYLKPYPEELKGQFYETYGGEEEFSHVTASPILGNLNSGMQLYWLKHRRPGVYAQIRHSLHLPQYMSYLVTGNFYSDITSIGCHTNLWNFTKNDYHEWVYQEDIIEKLAPVVPGDHIIPASFDSIDFKAGVGLHDSSAALIPYLVNFHEPFVLISTGTWCISLNPFNDEPLTSAELECDCLCYMTYKGTPVKASRLFAGNEHEQQVKRIAAHFNQSVERYKTMKLNPGIITALKAKDHPATTTDTKTLISASLFAKRKLESFTNDEEAYHQLIIDIITQQQASTQLVLSRSSVKKIFVDGGFSYNEIYMKMLASAFPGFEVYAASMAQATALGTALAIHSAWNSKALPEDLLELRGYAGSVE